MRVKKSFAGLAAVLAIATTLLMATTLAHAQTVTILHDFAPGPPDGFGASGLILDAAGNLYGEATYGGAHGGGIVFELSPSSSGVWNETILHAFSGGADGFEPYGGLLLDNSGNLYGTTIQGGSGSCIKSSKGPVVGCGTVFELSPAGGGAWTEKTLYAFGLKSGDGIWPYSNLVLDSTGSLYGTTSLGGSHAFCFMYGSTPTGCGTVFELKLNAKGVWTEKILHNFGAAGSDGQIPLAGVVFDRAGNLYGTTSTGGIENYCGENDRLYICGAIYELIPQGTKGWNEKFPPLPGWGFEGGLAIDSAGNLYGATNSGGGCGNDYNYGCGESFVLMPGPGGAWTAQGIGDFGSGSAPSPVIVDAQGNVYGTTQPTYNYQNVPAAVYKASLDGTGTWQITTLFQFSDPTYGTDPSGFLLRDAAGNLYGTTQGGGTHGKGVAFEITP